MEHTPLLLEQFSMYQANREDVTDYTHTVFTGYTESGLFVHIGRRGDRIDTSNPANDYRLLLGQAETGDITALSLKEVLFTPRRVHGTWGHVTGSDMAIEAYVEDTGELYSFSLSHEQCQLTGPQADDIPQPMLDLQSLGYELYRQENALPRRAELALARRALDVAS